MKSSHLFTLFCLVCFACGSVVSTAQAWEFPNLNPFSKSSSKRTHASVSDHSKWNVLPKIPMPKWPTTTSRAKHGPSTLDKLNHETKVLWYKTKGVLMPWSKPAPKKSYYSRSRTKKTSKPSFFASMFGSKKPEPKRPRTVSDFLAQERVPY